MADLATVSTVVEGNEGNYRQRENFSELFASASISRQLSDLNNLVGNISTSLASSNLIHQQSINELGHNITTETNQHQLQTLNSFNNLTTTMLTGFVDLKDQFATATNQIIAQGVTMAAQMAHCCCEIKEKIASDGQATRDLINSIQSSNLAVQLVDAKNQISDLNQTQTILAALGVIPSSSLKKS